MGYWDTYTSGGMEQGGDNSLEAKRKRAEKRARDKKKRGEADKRSAAGLIGTGMAGEAARRLKKRKQRHDEEWEKI